MKVAYKAEVPPHCPPLKAEDRPATLFRVCKSNPPTEDDFTSHAASDDGNKQRLAKRKLEQNPDDCGPFGLSVWVSEKSMRHACKALKKLTRGRFVFKADVIAGEGMLMLTGEDEHHTYWPRRATNLHSRAYFGFGPVNPDTINVD